MRILVGTHHKTGTVWMQKTFRQIAKTLGLDFVNLLRDPPPYCGEVLFHPHSGFDDTITAGDFRGLHLVRDPRDIAISALRYHRDLKELWLHEPRDEFGGVTYQEKLNSLSPDEQFLFDLHGSTSDTLRQILAWRYDDPRFFEATYEQLITDQRGEYFCVDHAAPRIRTRSRSRPRLPSFCVARLPESRCLPVIGIFVPGGPNNGSEAGAVGMASASSRRSAIVL